MCRGKCLTNAYRKVLVVLCDPGIASLRLTKRTQRSDHAQFYDYVVVNLRYVHAFLAILTPHLQTSITYRCH